MSDLAIFDSGKALPAHIRNLELDATTKALMGSGSSGRRISIEGGVWRLLVDGQEIAQKDERSLNVVIVAASEHINRMYYEGEYKKGVASSPVCWSTDGKYPDAAVKNPQSKSCDTCPQNIKGSGSGTSRACRYSQRVAVVLDNDLDGDVYQLQLPATSIFGEGEPGKWPLQTYARMLGTRGVPIVAVVTEMRFDTDSATPKVIFKPMRVLDDAEMTTAMEQGKTEDAIRAITLTITQTDKVPEVPARVKPRLAKPVVEDEDEDDFEEEDEAPAPKPKKRKAKPAPVVEDDFDEDEDEEEAPAPKPKPKKRKAKPAPVVEDDFDEDEDEDEEEEPAPKRRPSKKAETVADRNPDVLAVLDEWDD